MRKAVLALAALSAAPVHAATGTGAPWEPAIVLVSNSVSGPVAVGIAIIGIMMYFAKYLGSEGSFGGEGLARTVIVVGGLASVSNLYTWWFGPVGGLL